MTRTALIMAGGTGGHIFPALAIADQLRDRGWRIVWLGTRHGMEARLVPEHGFEIEWLSFAGVRGKGVMRLAVLPLQLLAAFWQAARTIFRIRPNVALGLGGYAAFPGGMMAALLGKPLAIHEQNAVAGMTNRVLACLADRVLLGLPAAFSHATDRPIPCRKVRGEWLGNPVRPAIAALAAPENRYATHNGPLRLLVVGGSLGATALNEMIPQGLSNMPAEHRPLVRHQAGAKHIDQLRSNYELAGVSAECLPFIDDMAAAYDWADLVVCRAGASTVAEIAAAGQAALFVPYPNAVDDHQTENARFLSDHDAAWLIPQSALTPQGIAEWLSGLDRSQLRDRAMKARMLARTSAASDVADIIEEMAR